MVLASMSSKIKRTLAKDKPNRRGVSTDEMRCACGNRLFRVLIEPIRRKERTKQSPDLRVTAECPLCGEDKRLKLGAPD